MSSDGHGKVSLANGWDRLFLLFSNHKCVRICVELDRLAYPLHKIHSDLFGCVLLCSALCFFIINLYFQLNGDDYSDDIFFILFTIPLNSSSFLLTTRNEKTQHCARKKIFHNKFNWSWKWPRVFLLSRIVLFCFILGPLVQFSEINR